MADSSPKRDQTASPGRFGFWYLLGFGAGGLAMNYASVSIQAIATPFYQMTLNVNPVSLGIVLALPRLWDAITDPLMGNISDNFHSRYGRRKPLSSSEPSSWRWLLA